MLASRSVGWVEPGSLANIAGSALSASATLTVQEVATPSFSPLGGSYAGPRNVAVTCLTPTATIHYTTSGQDPTEEGNTSCPAIGGGHNWQATAFSPQTGLYYFGTTDGCHVYYKTTHDFVENQWYQLSTVEDVHNQPNSGSVVAIEPATGKIRWRFPTVRSPTGGLPS